MDQYLIEKFDLYGKRQEKDSPPSLDRKLKNLGSNLRYCFSSLFLILGLIMVFIGWFVYSTSSGVAGVGGITLMIFGVLLILNSLFIASGVNCNICSCCDYC